MSAINLLKALAILLVTHSHMREFYPIKAIATGGLLGNTLFFFSSGFVITVALQRRPETLMPWYWRRVKRIYLQLWIVTLILISFGLITLPDIKAVAATFLVPGDYWFLPAIAALYPACYFVIKKNSAALNKFAVIITTCIYFVLYISLVDFTKWNVEDHVVVKTAYYFIVMVIGVHIAQRPGSGTTIRNGMAMLIGSAMLFFGILISMRLTGVYNYQFLAQLAALLWTVSLFKAISHPKISGWLGQKFSIPVQFLSGLTLQIYLVQVPVVQKMGLERLPFPLNVITFFVLIFFLAWVLNKTTDFVLIRIGPRRHLKQKDGKHTQIRNRENPIA